MRSRSMDSPLYYLALYINIPPIALPSPVILTPNATLHFEKVSRTEWAENAETGNYDPVIVHVDVPAVLHEDTEGSDYQNDFSDRMMLSGYLQPTSDELDDLDFTQECDLTIKSGAQSGAKVRGKFSFRAMPNSFAPQIKIVAGIRIRGVLILVGSGAQNS